MRIRDVTCTVLRRAPGARGYPLVRVWGEDGLVGFGEASPMHPDVTRVAIEFSPTAAIAAVRLSPDRCRNRTLTAIPPTLPGTTWFTELAATCTANSWASGGRMDTEPSWLAVPATHSAVETSNA